MVRWLVTPLVLAAAATMPAAAADDETPKAVREIYQCRTIADAPQRLACFDAAAAALAAAEKDQSLRFADEDAFRRVTAKEVKATVATARTNATGRWVFVLNDGTQWVQMDKEVLYTAPSDGDSFVLRRGPLNYRATTKGRNFRVRQIG